MEKYGLILDNSIFKTIFLRVACPEDLYNDYAKKVPSIRSIHTRIEQETGLTFFELFDQYYLIWLNELNDATTDLYIYIRKELISAKNEVKPQNEFEKKSLFLAAKYVLLFSEESILKENNNTINKLGDITLFIDIKTIFHVIWGHYIRFTYLNLKERNKSIFTEHSDLSFISQIENICKMLNGIYSFIKDREVLSFKIDNHYYRLVVEKLDNEKYRVVTFFKIHKNDEISKLYTQYKQIQLNANFILFTKH